MNCPKCGTEMEAGYLYTGNARGAAPIIWTKNPKKRTFITLESDVLIQSTGFPETLPPICICRSCRVMTMEY